MLDGLKRHRRRTGSIEGNIEVSFTHAKGGAVLKAFDHCIQPAGFGQADEPTREFGLAPLHGGTDFAIWMATVRAGREGARQAWTAAALASQEEPSDS